MNKYFSFYKRRCFFEVLKGMSIFTNRSGLCNIPIDSLREWSPLHFYFLRRHVLHSKRFPAGMEFMLRFLSAAACGVTNIQAFYAAAVYTTNTPPFPKGIPDRHYELHSSGTKLARREKMLKKKRLYPCFCQNVYICSPI